jgi:hypothetical protein
MFHFMNRNSQVAYIFLLLVVRGFPLSGEVHFPSTQDNREPAVYRGERPELLFVVIIIIIYLNCNGFLPDGSVLQ